jgi:hypothetical protein
MAIMRGRRHRATGAKPATRRPVPVARTPGHNGRVGGWSGSVAGAVLGMALLVAGCGAAERADRTPPPTAESDTPAGLGFQPPSSTGPSVAGNPSSGVDRAGPAGADPPSGPTLAGWTVTVYYTAVERFHTGARRPVTGCPTLNCVHGAADLGTYPQSFVDAVKDEGTGRTAAGRYLNWSVDTGYWLDDAPRDTAGRPLRPFESAAADPGVLRSGTTFAIVSCGTTEDGNAISIPVCDKLRTATWTVTDEFTPGLGGTRHVDVYIGEETGPHFTDTAWYTTLINASLRTR